MSLLFNILSRSVIAVVLPVVMYRCEGWAIKKAEHQGIDLSNCGAIEVS